MGWLDKARGPRGHGDTRAQGPRPAAGRATAVLAIALAGCVYVPRTTEVYDEKCRVMANHMELEGAQVAAIQHCENQGCVALIVAASAVTAATLIVSGTIVIVGNMAYWLERQTRCTGAS